jgi:hypothetical protein
MAFSAPFTHSTLLTYLLFLCLLISVAESSDYWLANINRQGKVAFGSDPSYQVYRNVVIDYGATGQFRCQNSQSRADH